MHELGHRHEVIHGESNRLLDGMCMRRELRALKHDSANVRMLLDALLGERNQLFFQAF